MERARHFLLQHGIEPESVRRITEGGDHSTYAVGDSAIIRITYDPDVMTRHSTEVQARQLLERLTRIPLAPILASGIDERCSYIIEQRFPGRSLEHAELSADGIGHLVDALRQLHSLAPPGWLPIVPDVDIDRARQRAVAALAYAPDADLTAGDILALPFPSRDAADVWLHADLKGEHLLADESGNLTGIIDWTDTARGDAAWDIGGLAISLTAQEARAISTRMGSPVSEIERGITVARLHTLHALARQRQGHSAAPADILRRQFSRAWDLPLL